VLGDSEIVPTLRSQTPVRRVVIGEARYRQMQTRTMACELRIVKYCSASRVCPLVNFGAMEPLILVSVSITSHFKDHEENIVTTIQASEGDDLVHEWDVT
jgi:hypothetical protein